VQTALRIMGRLRALLTLALLPLFTPSLGAQSVAIMESDHLRRSMRGYGLTTFQGTQIDTFQVEILGVMKAVRKPHMDRILARFTGGPLEHTGVIAGMSGSPVYIDGRLIGAVSHGWTLSKDPIGGITPITDMLEVARRPDTDPKQTYGRPIELDAETTRQLGRQGLGSLHPLAMPLAISGFSPAARQVLHETLEPMGLQVLDSPAGPAPSEQPTPFIPGASLGVQIIRGDYSATGIGTLTWVDGERFAGFGHHMMSLGATDLPATGAYIHDIIPNQITSFKLGTATQTVGAVRQDRYPAIAGTVGSAPDMLPVAIDLHLPNTDQSIHCEVLRHRDLSAPLVRAVLLSSLQAFEKTFGDATLRLRARISLADGRTLERRQIYSSNIALLTAALDAVRPLDLLLHNSFADLDVDSLHFDLEISENMTKAQITTLRLSTPSPMAGQQVALRVTLQPYRADAVEKYITLDLPADLEPGPLVLRVGSGTASEAWEAVRRPDGFVPRDVDGLLDLLGRAGSNDELVVELFRPGSGFTIDGRELPGLPPSAHAVLAADRSVGHLSPVQGEIILRQTMRTAYVLAGEQRIEMMLRKP
jgi:hypothetical protein